MGLSTGQVVNCSIETAWRLPGFVFIMRLMRRDGAVRLAAPKGEAPNLQQAAKAHQGDPDG
jgi:hypothetical protein